jgi:hypothetical protein
MLQYQNSLTDPLSYHILQTKIITTVCSWKMNVGRGMQANGTTVRLGRPYLDWKKATVTPTNVHDCKIPSTPCPNHTLPVSGLRH